MRKKTARPFFWNQKVKKFKFFERRSTQKQNKTKFASEREFFWSAGVSRKNSKKGFIYSSFLKYFLWVRIWMNVSHKKKLFFERGFGESLKFFKFAFKFCCSKIAENFVDIFCFDCSKIFHSPFFFSSPSPSSSPP